MNERTRGLLWDDADSSGPVDPASVPRDLLPNRGAIDPYDLADEITLANVDGVGSLTASRLIEHFGSASEVLRASERDLQQVDKIGSQLANKIVRQARSYDVGSLIDFCVHNDVQILSIDDVRYPTRLREIAAPPRLLYVRGEILPEDRFAVSIVGTRHCTNYGINQASRLARELVDAGFTVVSGLALGIDGAAHRAALNARGRTIAVLGGGVCKIFPREHEDLAGRVVFSGALISEYHPLTDPVRGNFPARNRIVSGLASAVIVVESGVPGGSLITAADAAEQNREVFALPGPVDSPSSKGCHKLLREGAGLVESVNDILDALLPNDRPVPRTGRFRAASDPAPGSLGISAASLASIARPPRTRKTGPLRSGKTSNVEKAVEEAPRAQFAPLPENASPDEQTLVKALGEETLQVDELVRKSGLSASRVIGLIAALEFKGTLMRREGNAVARRRL